MAIIVEDEQKSGSNLIRLLAWVGLLAVILIAIYYVFFSAPQLVIIPPSGNLSTIAPIANVNLNAQDVVNSPGFQSLHSSIPLPSPQGPASVGRPNPFVSP